MHIEMAAGDAVSAFGGILICNVEMDEATAEEVNKLFCEVVIAPSFSAKALDIQVKEESRTAGSKEVALPKKQFRTLLNGVLEQEKDLEHGKP